MSLRHPSSAWPVTRGVAQEPEKRIWYCVACGTIGALTDEEQTDVSRWYERWVRQALCESGLNVRPYPRRSKNDPNPDWLIVRPSDVDCIVECTVVFKDREHARDGYEQRLHICGGDIRKSNSKIYEALREKMSKYRSLVDGRAYVVAVRDETCGSRLARALELAFSAYMRTLTFDLDSNDVEPNWMDAWSAAQAEGLLRRFPHCSGLLYSDDAAGHIFVSNPNAEVPVPDDLSPFANIPKRVITGGDDVPLERGPLIEVTGEPYPHMRDLQID